MNEHLIFTIIMSIFWAILSTFMAVFFIDKKVNKKPILDKKEIIITSFLSSLFSTIPLVILVTTIATKTNSRKLTLTAVSIFGLSGFLLMTAIHVKKNLMQKKYGRLFVGFFTLNIILVLIGLNL